MKKSILLLLPLLAGCSTIIEGRSQEIKVTTSPSNASCILKRQNQTIATIASTPGSAYIEKTKYDINIICSKTGYKEVDYFNHSDEAGATFGNILLGGWIGWGIDSATGADNKYESQVNIILYPKK